MTPSATTTHANPKRVETVAGEADVSRDEFIGGRFHIRKNAYTGLFDVTAVRTHITTVTDAKIANGKIAVDTTYDFEAVVCRHKNVAAAMECAQGIDCVWGTPVGRLH